MEDLDLALQAARELDGQPDWRDLAAYHRLRGQGLRKPALAALDRFLGEVTALGFEQRRALADRLAEASLRFVSRKVLIPHPLHVRFLLPTLREWAEREPGNARPHLLMGLLHSWDAAPDERPADHFRRALALDPGRRMAREGLIRIGLEAVDYAQHHLLDGYLGDAGEDLAFLEGEAQGLIDGLPEGETRSALQDWRDRLSADAREWMKPAAERDPSAFARHSRNYAWKA